MNCRDLAEVLVEYIAGELPPHEAEQIRQHLDFCPPCTCYIETYQLTITLTRHLPLEPPPATLLDRLRAAIEEDRPQ